jgi:serine/threonine protein kinase
VCQGDFGNARSAEALEEGDSGAEDGDEDMCRGGDTDRGRGGGTDMGRKGDTESAGMGRGGGGGGGTSGSCSGGLVHGEEFAHGDRRYVAPEVLGGRAHPGGLYAADIFSLGASLYELASSERLPSHGEEYARFRQGSVPPLPGVSAGFAGLVAAMLQPDPGRRPSAEQLQTHPLLLPYAGAGGGSGTREGGREREELSRTVTQLRSRLAEAMGRLRQLEGT